MSRNKLAWFQLVDETGEFYKRTTASSVFISSNTVVDQFRKAVKAENSAILPGITSSQLLVYKNRKAFDKRNAEEGKEEPLKSSIPLGNLGETEDEALMVVVPSTSEQGWTI
jgi:hypothetical protein